MSSGARLRFMQAGSTHDVEEVGVRLPAVTPVAALGPGEVGYVIAGIKDVGEARSGETVTEAARPAPHPLEGYRDPKPMVFCGLYPVEGDDFADLREALVKLRLNDASFTFEPETSSALGFGFRCGFLGLLHMDIVRERLEREFDLTLIATAPSVAYLAHLTNGGVVEVDNPSAMPEPQKVDFIEEPFFTATVLLPREYTGTVMDLCQGRRGEMQKMEYLSEERVELVYRIPLAEVVVDFFDQLKSRTKGYASLDYEPTDYSRSDLVKVDVLLNNVPVDAFSAVVHRDKAADYGRKMTAKLRELIPRPAVRRAHPGRHRWAHRGARDGEGQAQGRARQVLRRRHHPQAQAAREAERGEAPHEEHRSRRGAPGGVRLRPAPRGVRRRGQAGGRVAARWRLRASSVARTAASAGDGPTATPQRMLAPTVASSDTAIA